MEKTKFVVHKKFAGKRKPEEVFAAVFLSNAAALTEQAKQGIFSDVHAIGKNIENGLLRRTTVIILASASPRRRELLLKMGIDEFDIRPSSHEEPYDGALGEEKAVERIALMKCRDAASKSDFRDIVIAADTLVFLDGEPLGKPRDAQDAARMLSSLSGREHRVVTGLAVSSGGKEQVSHAVTRVRFLPLTREEIDWYVRSGEPMDKAGAYGIQGLGGLLVDSIDGDYYNVVGLPVSRLAAMLKNAGFNVFEKVK